jgi:hypothetical protein
MGENIYAGPAKVVIGAVALFPEGENGATRYDIKQEKVDRSSGFFGKVTSIQAGNVDLISTTPFDNWGSLGTLYPPFLGVSVGATAGALVIGTRPHGALNADVPAKLWSPDGRLITMARSAITKHPEIHLAVDKPLFGPIEITGILASGKKMGTAGAFHTMTASGAADPGGQFTLVDFQAGAWTGAWGTIAGFGGDGGDPIEAEDEWVIVPDIKYSPLPVQKLVRAYKLDSISFMAKVRPYGPTQPQIDSAIGLSSSRTLGSRFANPGYDLILTGPNAKTITLKNADVFGAGYEFGGTKLGNGEIGFVQSQLFTAGAPGPLLVFSA